MRLAAALAALLVGVSAFAQSAAISASSPAALNQGNLRGATVAVTLTGTTYSASSTASHFTLATAVPGLTVHSASFNGARSVATLRLHYDGSDFDADATIAVTVAADGTGHNAALTTGTQAVVPVRWVNVSAKTVALTEGGGGGSYTVALESPPTGNVTVTVTSDNAAVTVGGAASTTLSFTTTTWATAQSVSVAPVDDNSDAHDELALVTNVATGGGYVSSAVANRTVRVTVADDEQTGTDYDVDDDRLIEISGHAQLNAVRWDLDGNGTPVGSATTSYAAAFPGAAAGMGCPDGGDANQTPDGCIGYELTADIDLDTDGDGATHENGSGDNGDAYHNGGSGWDPIGGYTSSTRYNAIFRGNGHVIRNLFARRDDSATEDYVGLFSLLGSSARIESLGLPDAYVRAQDGWAGAVVGWSIGNVVGCYATGDVVVAGFNNRLAGGLVGGIYGGSVAASYSIASVTVTVAGNQGYAGGLGGQILVQTPVTISNSWTAGPVSAQLPGGLIGDVTFGNPTVTASYYDTEATGQMTSPRGTGLSTADLQRPTAATGIYAYWDDHDMDGDGRVDADDDAWDFGQANQYPALKWGGHSATAQFALQPDTAPSYAGISASVPTNMRALTPIQAFQIPAPTGGNGAYDYTVAGLPSGLVFDEDGTGRCMAARTVCGTPAAAGTATVTVTAADADANIAASDRATLTFTIAVLPASDVDAGPPAVVPDPALREAMARALGRGASSLTEGHLLALSSLSAPWSGVSSLEGLAAASNLRRLELGGNAVADLSELSGLRLLEHLDLSDNAVSDLSELSGLTRLETLLLSGNRVSDLSPLRGMVGLRSLFLDGNAVSDLAPVVFLESLEELSLSGNPLGGLSPLCALRELKRLWLAASGLSDLSDLSCLTGLERLWLADNAVEDVGPLSGMRRLEWLDLERNAVADVAPLRRLNALTRLRLGSNRVADAGPLAANDGLTAGDVAGLRGNPLSEASIREHVPALRERGVAVLAGLPSPWFAASGDAAGRRSFMRLINRSEVAGEALVWGVDDAGERFGPARLSIGAGRAAHFNSEDLEFGNAAKGLADGLGAPTAGNWRLEILSTLDLEAQTFLRASGGPPSALHDMLPRVGGTLRAAFLPAGRERSPAGALRVSNPTGSDETVFAWGVDDAGVGRLATGLVAPAGRAVTVTASELERWRMGSGRGLGRGAGNWRLELTAPWPLAAQALAVGDGGRTGNLSGPAVALGPGVVARVPLFPPASATGRVGVARVWNLGAAAGEVLVTAVDDAGVSAGPVALALEAFAAAEFDSRELEEGGGPLAEGVGAPTRGSWRLDLRAGFGARVHARAVGAGGYATGLLEAAPRSGGAARVSMFNPGSNRAQRSLLRLANDGAEDVLATIEGVDDAGRAGGAVRVTVPAGEALWLSAAELESGGAGFEGTLGDGEGKWRLTVSSSAPLTVMSLVEDEEGALSNLSTPGRR